MKSFHRTLARWTPPVVVVLLIGLAWERQDAEPAGVSAPVPVTLSIVGTSDLHGRIAPRGGHGGLALLGGYVRNLRAARTDDGGAVLLIDAGDTFQGGIESNLSEGAVVVDTYNALGYAATAIGNHEFEFGAVDSPESTVQDPVDYRGALKARAAQARFPFLAANLLNAETGRVVDWPNVHPSVLVAAGDLAVGIVGVMTFEGLTRTLEANVQGLSTAPLIPTIVGEASRLRDDGADIVIVAAHAGGGCESFSSPEDLSSCDDASENFRVARSLPRGLVDVIVVAGHTHAGLAHQVAGIAIIEAFSAGQAFGRVDLIVDRATGHVSTVRLFPPQPLCAAIDPARGTCATDAPTSIGARYEGREVSADSAIVSAMSPALERVQRLRAERLGPVLETTLTHDRDRPESSLTNLYADALRAAFPDADVVVSMGGRRSGLRSDLPPGPLSFGALYDVYPFDNRVVSLRLAGAQFRQVLLDDLRGPGRGRLAVSGFEVFVTCGSGDPTVALVRA